jgi:alkylhydroperoxidase family enzyme
MSSTACAAPVVAEPIPRIAPLEPPYAADIQADFDTIMRGAPPLTLFRVMAKNARAWQKFRAGSLLDKGALSLRQREIVIDRTCALNRCEYEWGVHVAVFAKAAELTDEQVSATINGGHDAPCWSASEQALLRSVDALHHGATLSDEEFAALAAHYDEAQIFEIILLAGFYRTVSYLANGLRLPLEQTAARFASSA